MFALICDAKLSIDGVCARGRLRAGSGLRPLDGHASIATRRYPDARYALSHTRTRRTHNGHPTHSINPQIRARRIAALLAEADVRYAVREPVRTLLTSLMDGDHVPPAGATATVRLIMDVLEAEERDMEARQAARRGGSHRQLPLLAVYLSTCP